MIYRARAPLRISFSGGSTDIAPYCDLCGGLVFNATINRYVTVSFVRRDDYRTRVRSRQFGTQTLDRDKITMDGRYRLVNAVILKHAPDYGFDLYIEHDAPAGSGLGGSSALVIALISLFDVINGEIRSHHDLALEAYKIERIDCAIAGGQQDQWASVYGGFNEIWFEKEFDNRILPISLSSNTIWELEHNLLLCHSGVQRADTKIIQDQIDAVKRGQNMEILKQLKATALEMIDCLFSNQLDHFGKLLHIAWMNKRRTSDKISTPHIDRLYEIALENGATGGKISGAGGGGYMFFYCPNNTRYRVAQGLTMCGAKPVKFNFTNLGVQTWKA